MLPPYWNNDDFLGFAFCIVLHQNKINPHIFLDIDCKLDSKTIDHDHLYEYHFFTYVEEQEVSSDHVLMWYVTKPTLQEEMNGLNWPSTCSTEAFFHVWHEYYDSRVYGRKSEEIKKFGVRLVYKQDIDRLDAKTVRKNKRRFNECCESSGSEAVDSLEEEDDDESHSKKLEVINSEMMPHQQPPLKAFMHIKSVDAKASPLSVVSALFRFFFCLFFAYSVSANDALVDDSDDASPI
nr:uncharacterized protein LOC125419135 [Ziziphus jujuba var. spinosa]